MITTKTYPPGAYQCPACYSAFDSYDAYDQHRRIEHGRDGRGVLVVGALYHATLTMEQRLARLEAIVARLLAKEASE